MTIGFSIQVEALIAEEQVLLADFDNLEGFLIYLRSCGVQSIEIRKLKRHLDCGDYEALNRSVQLIWDMGFQITVHGDTSGDVTMGRTFLEVYPTMSYILNHYNKYQDNLVVTVHALQADSDKGAEEGELQEKTFHLLQNWLQLIERDQLPIRIALENNRKKSSKVDPGDSCEGVLSLVRQIDSPYLGICWDMGHYQANLVMSGKNGACINSLPPKEFLHRVIHTHIHGLNAEMRTHFPLEHNNSERIDTYLKVLAEAGYEGVYNLELSFKRYEEEMRVAERVKASINRLKQHESEVITF